MLVARWVQFMEGAYSGQLCWLVATSAPDTYSMTPRSQLIVIGRCRPSGLLRLKKINYFSRWRVAAAGPRVVYSCARYMGQPAEGPDLHWLQRASEPSAESLTSLLTAGGRRTYSVPTDGWYKSESWSVGRRGGH